ncbi:C-glycoside deglycosidase beta subunit domain-containing protein [Actinomadura opuntiae]|uniref:C-glycoside deglycosidase beta subunit domain-containing protein n=1 Tax=Actinomadura sp. OS1-43 TaxID=604315 RepID=UPI00255AADF8|nr:DUF6379 domain-containing protein [Actinomadura sp. OS1-43]MDL4821090.1 DUF6379 domain-containing protein [Actinomadura sp. OS1-43]
MFRERIIVDDSLAATPDGYELAVRLPWYRALPVSSIEQLDITLDGVRAPAEAITFEVNGRARTLAEAKQAWDDVWYVLDDGIVRVAADADVSRGEHELEVTLGVRIPYLPVAGKPLLMTERSIKTMPATNMPATKTAPAEKNAPAKETAE